MKCIEKLVNDIYSSSNIPFKLKVEGVGEYSTPQYNVFEDYTTKEVLYRDIKYRISINHKFRLAIELLELCINSKLNEIFVEKERVTISLLDGVKVDEDIIKNVWPEINEGFNLINIYVKSKHDKIISYIRKNCLSTNIQIIKFRKYIIIIGNLEECNQYANNIAELINDEFAQRCYISHCSVKNYLTLKKAFDTSMCKIEIAKKYNIKENIFDEKNLILESIIDSISDEVKDDFLNSFSNSLLALDNEMIKTIDVFFKCGLNISEAAKELYIHRNTLIYRLDKIEKYTTYNIREFNNAMLFKIAFFYLGRKKNLMVENI